MTKENLKIIILAAGKGTRMKSSLPKVMHKIAGREMINMVLDCAVKLNPSEINVVISDDLIPFQEKIEAQHPQQKLNFVVQKERLGTAHAARIGLDADSQKSEKILILYGDTPLLQEATLREMLDKLEHAAICVLGFDCFDEDNAYGRLVLSEEGDYLEKIVEYKDADEFEKTIPLCNSGVIAVDGKLFTQLLDGVDNNNAKNEYYLTDIVKIAGQSGYKSTFVQIDEDEVLGVNSRYELANVEALKQAQLRLKFMEEGVSLLDFQTVYFSYDTKIAPDVEIGQNVVFGKGVEIESGVLIKPFCHIEGVKIKKNAVIGPFARIRPDSVIEEGAKVGNFVEIKNSLLKNDAKVNHLSYVGDASVGVSANVGAGVITCNYDGFKKSKTEIGDGVFVGSNSALVAPVKIGEGALVAAGSVITKDVAGDELAVGRSLQKNLAGGAKKFRDKNRKG